MIPGDCTKCRSRVHDDELSSVYSNELSILIDIFYWLVILSINFIANGKKKKIEKYVIFSRIYLKPLWKENIPSSISLSLKTYWYKYLNFNFLLLGLVLKYILQGSYEDKIVDFFWNYRYSICIEFYYKWNYIFYFVARRKIYLEMINLKIN